MDYNVQCKYKHTNKHCRCLPCIPDESTARYQALQAHIADLLNKLNTALAGAQGLQGSLDSLLRWLDQAERDVTKMDRGTIVVAKREPLQENIEEQMVRDDQRLSIAAK